MKHLLIAALILTIGFPTGALALTPNDPLLHEQWYLETLETERAWDTTIGNDEVVVAVLDSGVDLDHPDLEQNIWTNSSEIPGDGIDNDNNGFVDDVNGWDFVEDDNSPTPDEDQDGTLEAVSHGTAIAGVTAAIGNNREGIAGISWRTKIMSVRILNNLGSGRSDNATDAIHYAVANGADVISLSITGEAIDPRFRTAVQTAYDQGVLVIAAVGNGGQDLDKTPIYPACFTGDNGEDIVLGVAATTEDDTRASFSNFGVDCTDISAPGDLIFGLSYYNPNYEEFDELYKGYWSGTSIAVPMVSGAVALLLAEYPDLTPTQVKQILQLSVDPVKKGNLSTVGKMGAGRLNVAQALDLASSFAPSQSGQTTSDFDVRLILASADAGTDPTVRLFQRNGGNVQTFNAYSPAFTGGVRSAFGDINGDGNDEIVTTPGPGGGAHVRIFTIGGALVGQFFAEGVGSVGLHVATGDIDGDGTDEIIVGEGPGGNGTVRVYNTQGSVLRQFAPFTQQEAGVRVAAGDMNGNGNDEIIVSRGAGFLPEVRVFSDESAPNEVSLMDAFMAYGLNYDRGVYVSAGDIDGDGLAEIVTGTDVGGGPHVRAFSSDGTVEASFFAYDPNFRGGVRVGVGRLNGAKASIVTAAGPGGGPHLRVFNETGTAIGGFFADDEALRSGMFLSVTK